MAGRSLLNWRARRARKESVRWTISTWNCRSWSPRARSQGYLTYDEVNDYLPDEAVDPEKLDNLLIALDEQGIELVNECSRARVL